MSKVGRPRLFDEAIKVNFRVDSSLKKALESYAAQKKMTVSQVVREALSEFLRSHASHYTDGKGILRSRKL